MPTLEDLLQIADDLVAHPALQGNVELFSEFVVEFAESASKEELFKLAKALAILRKPD